MKKKRNYKLVIITAVFCFIYIQFAFKPLGSELHLTPDWTFSITRPAQEIDETDKLIPFKLGQTIGYFTENGKLASSITYNFNAAISSDFYATYNADNTVTKVLTPSGEEKTSIKAAGFPYFSEDRLFVFLPGGTSVAHFSDSGEKLWQYESYAPITAFSSTKGGSVIGFADGNIVSLDSNGTVNQQFYPGGSDIPVISGADISEDGHLIACVCGQKKQRFVVSEKNGEHSKIIFHEYLDEETNSQVLVKFNKKADTIYYNHKNGIGVVNLQESKSSHIPLKGIITQIEESEENNLIFILSKNNDTYTLSILEPFDQILSQTSFKAKSSFIQIRGDYVFMGRDDTISRMTISKQ